MDIQKEKRNYLKMLVAEGAITLSQCNSLCLYHGGNYFHSESISSSRIDCINWGWQAWLKATKAKAVPEGYVVVPKNDLMTILCNCSDAMENESTSSVYDKTGEPSTWFDHHIEAEKRILALVPNAQEQNSNAS